MTDCPTRQPTVIGHMFGNPNVYCACISYYIYDSTFIDDVVTTQYRVSKCIHATFNIFSSLAHKTVKRARLYVVMPTFACETVFLLRLLLSRSRLILTDPEHHDRTVRNERDEVCEGRSASVVPDEDRRLPQRERAQLQHQLEGRASIQCTHPQAQVCVVLLSFLVIVSPRTVVDFTIINVMTFIAASWWNGVQ